MTDIEQKALELVNAAVVQKGIRPYSLSPMRNDSVFGCLCRALEAREADKSRHAAELREQAERFSEAVQEVIDRRASPMKMRRFILAPVDPLAEVIRDVEWQGTCEQDAADLRAALDARGLAIVKKDAVNG